VVRAWAPAVALTERLLKAADELRRVADVQVLHRQGFVVDPASPSGMRWGCMPNCPACAAIAEYDEAKGGA